MNRVTIIREDNVVSVDGVFRPVNLGDMDPGIHAVQWDGQAGWVEYNDGRGVETLNSIGIFLPILDRYNLAAPAPAPTPDPTAAAEAEVLRLRAIAVAELEDRRLESALRAEAEKVTGSPAAKAYVAARTEVDSVKDRKS